ncbi:MAG: nucleotidyltransferase [Planctomycetota bacterium]|nr:nucleotidyltransferase [Planctomycetota bacterium]
MMMTIHAKFRTFDETIRLKRFAENAELREKRDRVLTRLRGGIQKQFPSPANRPTFDFFNQGSYEMGTGVKPLGGDYDIDVGLVLNIDISHHRDPVAVKEWVYKAVKEHTTDVRFRRSCVTVFYVEGGEPKYHVDLAIYGKDAWGNHHLASGKQGGATDQRKWVRSEPKRLTDLVDRKFSGEDANQFRRVIRYLKRWKDFQFSSEGAAAPTGIGLTACALSWFATQSSSLGFYSYGTQAAETDDLGVTTGLVEKIRSNFTMGYSTAGLGERIRVVLPVPPHNDIFEKLSNQQMQEFKQRLDALLGNLRAARKSSEQNACQVLRRTFGEDFPA